MHTYISVPTFVRSGACDVDGSLDAFILSRWGEEALNRVIRRNRGGANNQKGADYEDCFAVYCLARNALHVFDANVCVEVRAQARQFVDDLVIYEHHVGHKKSHQLKNVASLSWVEVCDDFVMQRVVDVECEGVRQSTVYLVLSSRELVRRMQDALPNVLQEYAQCIYFPDLPVNRMLLEFTHLRDCLAELCEFPDQEDKLTVIHAVLMGVWKDNRYRPRRVRDFIEEAARCANPNYFRLPEAPVSGLDVRLKDLLDNCENLTYEIHGKHLNIEWRSGVVRIVPVHQIDSAEFLLITEQLLALRPMTERELVQRLLELM